MIGRLVTAIRACDPDATSTDVADVLWLAGFLQPAVIEAVPEAVPPGAVPRSIRGRTDELPPTEDAPSNRRKRSDTKETVESQRAGEHVSFRLPPTEDDGVPKGIAVRSPAVPAIPNQLGLSRSLRPIGRKVPSRRSTAPNERRTSEMIAETGLWIPAIEPSLERWLDVAMVVDSSASMAVWGQTVAELHGMLERAGIFRDVRLWYLDGDSAHRPALLHSELGRARAGRDPSELIDPAGRRLVLVVSDCVGQAWGNEAIAPTLARWAHSGPVAILQLLPQRLWVDCAPQFVTVRMHNPAPGAPNARWAVQSLDLGTDLFETDMNTAGVPIPVVQLEPRWLSSWASLVAGAATGWVNGTALLTNVMSKVDVETPEPVSNVAAMDRVKRFRARASPEAYKLAVFLSSAPLSLPVMRLVQQTMLPDSKPSHLAEVFLSDLLHSPTQVGGPNVDVIEYDFVRGVRGELLGQLSKSEALQVLSQVSNFVSRNLGSANDFPALLTLETPPRPIGLSRPFALVAHDVLRSLGGRYADAAHRLRHLGEVSTKYAESRTTSPSRVRDSNDESHGADLSQIARPLAVEGSQRPETEPVLIEPVIMRGVPPRNPHFTGRGDMLDNLHSLLINSSRQAALLPHMLHGLGGVGKTQLAVEYVYRYSHEYELVYWISAENPDQVRNSLASLGSIMRLPESVNVSRTAEAVLDALRTRHPFRKWLLVFDNADQPDDLLPFLPFPTGHVLITSRNSGWAEVATTMEVDVLHRDESVQLLRRRGKHISENDAEVLAEKLGDLPLALEQAAAWQAETSMSVREYLDLFDDQIESLTEEPPANYPKSLWATWKLSFDRLREHTPEAGPLLELCAFLGAEPIPVSLFGAGRNAELPADLARTMQDNVRLRRALREINRYALGKLDQVADRLTVHRLVQTVLRSTMAPDDRNVMQRSARRLLASANPGEPENIQTWAVHEQLSPHIVPSGVIESGDEQTRKVVLDQIRYRYARGDYEGSRDLGELVVERWQKKWGPADLWTLIARRHLATTLRVLGDSERAYELNKETLETMRRTLGEDDEHTLATADTYAADLRRRGLFQQARESDEDNLARHVRVFGEEEQATARVRNNLAVNYRLLGNARQAMELDEGTLKLLRRIFGNNHQRTLFSISNMVRDIIGLGEYARALHMQEEVFAAHQALLGPRHSEVLLAARNIVIAKRKVGQYRKARTEAVDHLERCRQRLGPNHEHTLAAMTSYGNTLRDCGDLRAAKETIEDAFDRYSETFGPQHPFTLACAINLAIVLRLNHDFRAALAMNERTRDDLIRALGEDHPAVLCCSANLSNDLAMLHEHARAREVSADTLVRSRAARGENHPYTLACAINAALDLQATGEQEAGQHAFNEALTELRRQLGENHPEGEAIARGARADCDIEVSPT
jgi:hypothetical protein